MSLSTHATREYSSFRDPSGYVFEQDGTLYRQVNQCYQKQYEKAKSSGLYASLMKNGLLIPHEEKELPFAFADGFQILAPQRVPYISYPYEWTFNQYKDAALTTLRVHLAALEQDMILKDASVYNIQFVTGRPVLIDTLSFDFYEDGAPWLAYGQFCRHFLAPLLLMCYVDIRLSGLMRNYIDGIPLDLADTLLHGKGGMLAKQHIRWHANAMKKHETDGRSKENVRTVKISKFNQIALVQSVMRGIEKLERKHVETEWGDYYLHTNYSDAASQSKRAHVQELLKKAAPKAVWDMGANDGTYSALALEAGASVVAFDIDPVATEKNYSWVKKNKKEMLPLILDLTNPSPAIGFGNAEREVIGKRQKPDCIMALALIHHLAISNNVPFEMIFSWLAKQCRYLLMEFVPKEDSQVQILLATRPDIFPQYTQAGFETAAKVCFDIAEQREITGSDRVLYLLKVKE